MIEGPSLSGHGGPVLFVDRSDGGILQVPGIRPKHLAFAGSGVPISHLPHMPGIGATFRTG
jgi:hypothetical protein